MDARATLTADQEAAVERAVVARFGEMPPDPAHDPSGSTRTDWDNDRAEARRIFSALAVAGGVRVEAARALELSERVFYKRVEVLGLADVIRELGRALAWTTPSAKARMVGGGRRPGARQ
jgi:hypothetical protein